MNKIIASGKGTTSDQISGKSLEWQDALLESNGELEGHIIINRGALPLYRAAFLVEQNAAGVISTHGSSHTHPYLLLKEAQMPAIVGTGELPKLPDLLTLDVSNGTVQSDIVYLDIN